MSFLIMSIIAIANIKMIVCILTDERNKNTCMKAREKLIKKFKRCPQKVMITVNTQEISYKLNETKEIMYIIIFSIALTPLYTSVSKKCTTYLRKITFVHW